eukprot:TRINITY_DN1155_c0_g1_i2.p1 TRINITY_DN1155_c0_g1~~TRINITY_DN1155_c0_g1_i2.p1  ORF type:complete len:770 (-),score=192.75 TRINITY_DN1155_c0_g1_i2:478-2787(-)
MEGGSRGKRGSEADVLQRHTASNHRLGAINENESGENDYGGMDNVFRAFGVFGQRDDKSKGANTAPEDEHSESFHFFTLRFVDPTMEHTYEEYYWDRSRTRLQQHWKFLLGGFIAYTIALCALINSDDLLPVLLFHILLVIFPMSLMVKFGNNEYLPHQLALLLGCCVFVLGMVGSILGVGLVLYTDVLHPIVYAGLFFVTGCLMPKYSVPFIHTLFVNFIIFSLYVGSKALSENGFKDEPTGLSIVLLATAVLLNCYIAREKEIQMRLEFLYSKKVNVENDNLRKQVWSLEQTNGPAAVGALNVDLESPVEKAVSVIKELIRRQGTAENDAKNLEHVLRVITQHQDMLKPDFEQQLDNGEGIDEEIGNWLFYELASKENKGTGATGESWMGNRKPTANPNRRLSALSILPSFTPQEEQSLERMIAKENAWGWDVFELNSLTHGRPLYFVAMYLFKKYDFLAKFKIDEVKLQNFFKAIEDGYGKKIPYHNNMHAADVLLSVNFLLTNGKIKEHLSEIDLFSALLAAAVHDYNHPGVNNAFQINTASSKALIYNDKSVLENYHISAAWMLLKQPQNDIVSNLSDADRKTVRNCMIDMILATDMAFHFETVGDLKSKLSAGEINLTEQRTKMLMLKVALKVADIGHTAKKIDLHEKWTDRVQTEFYEQGDKEASLGLDISPFMDRKTSNIPKSQVGFINFVVMPLFEAFNFTKDYDVLLNQLKANQHMWETRMKEDAPGTSSSNAPASSAAAKDSGNAASSSKASGDSALK